MSQEEFKYPVDLSKLKSNKLYSKFVKSLQKDNTKPKEQTSKPIEYNTQYQSRAQPSERATLVKPIYGHASETVPLAAGHEFTSNQLHEGSTRRLDVETVHNNSSLKLPLPQPQAPFQDIVASSTASQQRNPREGRRGGTFRAEFASRQYVSQQEEKPKTFQPTYAPPATYTPPPVIQQPPSQRYVVQPQPQASQDSQKTIQQYKAKLEKLSQAFEEFKNSSIVQNRQKKSELISYQETIEIMKEKMYEVQSREDELILENQRLKQKANSETVLRTRLEEQGKELEYKVQELTDMLESREAALRKKSDEAAHWKSQTDSLKGEIQNIKLANERLELSLSMYEEQQQSLKREKQNKDSLQMDMKEKVSMLIRENSNLKEDMMFLSAKLDNLQNQNMSMRSQLKRESNMSLQSSHHEQSHYRPEVNREPRQPREPQPAREPRRRGEFNREREKANETREGQKPQGSMQQLGPGYSDPRRVQPPPQQPNPDVKLNELSQQRKLLEEEVEKLRDLKSMSGAMRKRKIEMERELQALTNKIAQLRGEPKQ